MDGCRVVVERRLVGGCVVVRRRPSRGVVASGFVRRVDKVGSFNA